MIALNQLGLLQAPTLSCSNLTVGLPDNAPFLESRLGALPEVRAGEG
jgi:hypothetical protein